MLYDAQAISGFHKGYDFNETIILAYRELAQSTELMFNSDCEFQAYTLFDQTPLHSETLCASDLESNLVLPVFTEGGLLKVRGSMSGLTVTSHKLIRSHAISIKNGVLRDAGNAEGLNFTGSYFSGSFHGRQLYGYVSTEEIKAITGLDEFKNISLLKSLLLETSLYRGLQRMDDAILPPPVKQFKYIHDLRNFTQFRKTELANDFYVDISEVVNSRKDYLTSVSRLWSKSFSAQMSFLSYSLAEIASEYNLTKDATLMFAYKLAGEAAMANTNLSPVSGDSYILAIQDPDTSRVELLIKETTAGRLKRCYSKASLRTVRADVVYDTDTFLFEPKEMCTHTSDCYNDKERGHVIGSYCTLSFNDGTHVSVFIEEQELNDIALLSGHDTWNGVFSDRMKIKQAISSALSLCNWGHKASIAFSAYD